MLKLISTLLRPNLCTRFGIHYLGVTLTSTDSLGRITTGNYKVEGRSCIPVFEDSTLKSVRYWQATDN